MLCGWSWPLTTQRRGSKKQVAASSPQLRHSRRKSFEGGQFILCEQMTADSGKNADWPRVSSERLHRDVMDGARLFPRRVPANGALMAFQSAAPNYGVELMAPAHSWEASTTVLPWYQYSEFDLSLKGDTISIQIRKTTKQCHRRTDDCLSSHIWAGFNNFSSGFDKSSLFLSSLSSWETEINIQTWLLLCSHLFDPGCFRCQRAKL